MRGDFTSKQYLEKYRRTAVEDLTYTYLYLRRIGAIIEQEELDEWNRRYAQCIKNH